MKCSKYLINNITHEFKTPIATISTAIEAIESFNVADNKEKTKQYAAISAFQLKKLHAMVEKLLETATLDSESLMLQKEPTNIVDFIAKIANGLADDLLTNLCLARKCPLLIAPAMNIEMFSNSSTQRNLATIKKDGVHVSGPDHGDQACGDFGMGRLINYESLMLDIKRSTSGLLFKGKKILISTGATVEKIDDARAITNLSSGFMGLCLANAAYEFGADVTVIKGVSSHSIPSCIKSIDARNHNEMHEAITSNVRGADIYISVAAISDYKPISNDGKIKKSNSKITLNLMPTQDILGSIGRENGNTFLVGFAAESSNLLSNAKKKLKSKNLDIVIGNLISQSMGKSSAEIIIVDNEGEKILPEAPKPELSKIILRHIHKTFSKEKSYEPIS